MHHFFKTRLKKRRQDISDLNEKSPYFWIATWFGSGLMIPASGTWGSIAALPLCLVLLIFYTPLHIAITAIFIFLIGIISCNKLLETSSLKDPSFIVIDEVAGLLITFIFAQANVVSILLAFLLFRLFDIWKPFPISYLDHKCGGAFGIMIDDIIAGLFAGLLLMAFRIYGGIG